jgi:hypothetical protein
MGLLDGLWQVVKAGVQLRGIQLAIGAIGVGLGVYLTAKGLGWGQPTLSIGGANGIQIRVSWIMWIVVGIIALIVIMKVIRR